MFAGILCVCSRCFMGCFCKTALKKLHFVGASKCSRQIVLCSLSWYFQMLFTVAEYCEDEPLGAFKNLAHGSCPSTMVHLFFAFERGLPPPPPPSLASQEKIGNTRHFKFPAGVFTLHRQASWSGFFSGGDISLEVWRTVSTNGATPIWMLHFMEHP